MTSDDETRELFDLQMRREASPDGPGARVERVGSVVRQDSADAAGWCGVVHSALDAASADAAIVAQTAYFTRVGRSFEWKLYGHDRPADLGDRLLAAGFTAGPEETLMVAESAALDTGVPLPAGVRLRRVTDAAGVELMARAHDRAFGGTASWWAPSLAARLEAEPDTVHALVVLAGDEPVCAARLELPPGRSFACLWGGGTVPEWRGRGIYRALVAHRAGIAAAHGYRYLQVDASDDSRPILGRLGFRVLGTTTPFTYHPVPPTSGRMSDRSD